MTSVPLSSHSAIATHLDNSACSKMLSSQVAAVQCIYKEMPCFLCLVHDLKREEGLEGMWAPSSIPDARVGVRWGGPTVDSNHFFKVLCQALQSAKQSSDCKKIQLKKPYQLHNSKRVPLAMGSFKSLPALLYLVKVYRSLFITHSRSLFKGDFIHFQVLLDVSIRFELGLRWATGQNTGMQNVHRSNMVESMMLTHFQNVKPNVCHHFACRFFSCNPGSR